jgi:hypothetical protein
MLTYLNLTFIALWYVSIVPGDAQPSDAACTSSWGLLCEGLHCATILEDANLEVVRSERSIGHLCASTSCYALHLPDKPMASLERVISTDALAMDLRIL